MPKPEDRYRIVDFLDNFLINKLRGKIQKNFKEYVSFQCRVHVHFRVVRAVWLPDTISLFAFFIWEIRQSLLDDKKPGEYLAIFTQHYIINEDCIYFWNKLLIQNINFITTNHPEHGWTDIHKLISLHS